MQDNSGTELLILNTVVVDIRSPDFSFVPALAGPGGLAKCATAVMPAYSQESYRGWIATGCATAGGPGNTAPLASRAGVRTAVGGYIGLGNEDGFDVPGRWFRDVLAGNGVDVSSMIAHPSLPTGITFMQEVPGHERGGLAYFPNANNAFDFSVFKSHVQRLRPEIVYYMYSGLSDTGDANGGHDLAGFMRWCRTQGCLTTADSHTLCSDPERLIREGVVVPEYRLVDPLLPHLDLFFTSWDEARMIRTALGTPLQGDRDTAIPVFLEWLVERYAGDGRPRLFGVTLKDGAYTAGIGPGGSRIAPRRTVSRFRSGGVVDLVGAGDSFRAGVISYVARHKDEFKAGKLDFEEAVQMGNLMATLYVTAPLGNRYGRIPDFRSALSLVRSGRAFEDVESLTAALSGMAAL